MSIIIGADIVPSVNNRDLFISGNINSLIGNDLIQILHDADYRVFNLETPLTDVFSPINKCGPALCADCSTVAGLKKLDVDLFTLANNHIMDQGVLGLESTISVLNENRICYLGAGSNLMNAQKAFVTQIKEKNIGFYACAEHEFSIAGENAPGANPFDALESFDHVVDLKSKSDFVIVLYHGGKEHYQYPSPMLQQICRKFIQKGADLVICQHSHCIGCEERFGKGIIIYGQGNFIFDTNCGPYSDTGLLVKLNDDLSLEYLPLVKSGNGVCLATAEKKQEILDGFTRRSMQINEKKFIEKEYEKFAKKKVNSYLLTCNGFGHKILFRIINKLSGYRLSSLLVKAYKKDELLTIRNFIECEAHRELFLEGLKKLNV